MTAIRLSNVLIVTGSSVLREMLRIVFQSHAESVTTAADFRAASDAVTSMPGPELVLCDVDLGEGDGFRLLGHVRSLESAPQVILVTSRPNDEDARRARDLGAVGYLAKPLSFLDIARVLRRGGGPWNDRRMPRRHGIGRACLVDEATYERAGNEGGTQLRWYYRNVSVSGAFVETDSPVPVGTRLDLALELDADRVRVSGEVVRIQEPDWGQPAGVGLRFVDFASGARMRLAEHVASVGAEAI
jgi:CheY-like chemotaxis protein/Tfp pilus assembly protein PilZ